MNQHDKERLERLIRRKEFLNKRIETIKDKDLTFDKAEAGALIWGIEIIKKYFVALAPSK